MAESFSRIGVPVFAADVKGDLSGISQPGKENPKLAERIKKLKLEDFTFSGCPVTFWDVFGEQGHPIRATVSEMGPLLFSRLLNLNDTQSGVLSLVFKIADESQTAAARHERPAGDAAARRRARQGFPDAVRQHFSGQHRRIQRGLVTLGQEGGDKFFGEPALNLDDLMQTDTNGHGVVNILAADKLIRSPRVYATLLLWLLTELYERLPEVGDPEKPKLVFFFDEAHLLFADLPPVVGDKVKQIVRLIRSKGVGVYFVTQNPIDVPDDVLGQLGNRVQHALRAFTPKDQKAVKAAAQTFRANPKLDVEKTITRAGGRRGAGFLPRRKGYARHRGTRTGLSSAQPDRPDHSGAAPAADGELDRRRGVRHRGGSRVGLRASARARRTRRPHKRQANRSSAQGQPQPWYCQPAFAGIARSWVEAADDAATLWRPRWPRAQPHYRQQRWPADCAWGFGVAAGRQQPAIDRTGIDSRGPV